MTTEPATIRLARPTDAHALADLGARVFRRTFGDDPDHRPDDIELFLAEYHSPPALDRFLVDPTITYYVAERVADDATTSTVLVGYIKLCDGAVPACVSGPDPLEIAQLYVDFAWHGGGVAHALMEAAETHAFREGRGTLWLGVWHRNLRAQRFYRKWGFEHVGRHPFQLGNDPQTDEVFARPLARAHTDPGRAISDGDAGA